MVVIVVSQCRSTVCEYEESAMLCSSRCVYSEEDIVLLNPPKTNLCLAFPRIQDDVSLCLVSVLGRVFSRYSYIGPINNWCVRCEGDGILIQSEWVDNWLVGIY